MTLSPETMNSRASSRISDLLERGEEKKSVTNFFIMLSSVVIY